MLLDAGNSSLHVQALQAQAQMLLTTQEEFDPTQSLGLLQVIIMHIQMHADAHLFHRHNACCL